MVKPGVIGASAAALIGGGLLAGYLSCRWRMRQARRAYSRLIRSVTPSTVRFDPSQVENAPEIARRYFFHAIAPGTPLYSAVELEMSGTFLLGNKDRYQSYTMEAKQVLRAPGEFVWLPKLRSGALSITGSDALVAEEAWTRFWLLGAIPVAQERTSSDLVRSAQFRAAIELALWLPATLLPSSSVRWQQIGPDEALVTLFWFRSEIELRLKFAPSGAPMEVIGQRWSNANADKKFRLQPFGGTVLAERSFQGLTIPTRIAVGNHYGTSDYLPFFQATINHAEFS
jgi:hypothetical protein